MHILGIDPGLNGAMILLSKFGDIDDVYFFKNNESEIDLTEFIEAVRRMKRAHKDMVVFLEKVHAMPGQGVTSMFGFGKTYGMIRGVLAVYDIPTALVTPREWMKTIHLDHTKGLNPKERSLAAALDLYPGIDMRKTKRSTKAHDGFVDALLIAEYGRRCIHEKKLS